MGFEHKIRFTPTAPERLEEIVRRVVESAPVANGWPDYDASVEPDGVYFLDNGQSDAAQAALQRLLDEALAQDPTATLVEL